ncbi:PAP2 superfamily C-terminal [Dyadobacter koreensis]|uniref:PAP2 superfamily C-terminal n=1 Tax=Dyadobacter koreensis TaxID=408657 RepID=A0A1H6XRS0_9BACT|nr:phosphatase PAP2-related protein [Dyadobacter koreensis]SEJ30876.1 PAP2 superfamily C-terminal [Dyadobacter koreensis]
MISSVWRKTWENKSFKTTLFSGVLTLSIISCFLNPFFQAIEIREGIQIDDILLSILPAKDCSEAIFILIWSCVALATIRFLNNPMLFIVFLWSYVALCLTRIITISLVPLDAPAGLIPLRDPLSNYFYGQIFITKDLFYSGHTATLFLIFLCLEKKNDRLMVLFATGVVGLLLLVQHVHYSMDVLAAPFFAYFNVFCARKFLQSSRLYQTTDEPKP